MPDRTDLIEELAHSIECGNEVSFDHIVAIHGRIKQLRERLEGQIQERQEAAGIAAEADLLLEKIIMEYVANTPAALRNLKQILASLHKAARGLETRYVVGPAAGST